MLAALPLAAALCQQAAPAPDLTLTVVDRIDGTPVPGIQVIGLTGKLFHGHTASDGRARFDRTEHGPLEPGTYTVRLSARLHGHWSEHKVTLPAEGPLPIEIGPLFFFDFPDWVPEKVAARPADARDGEPRTNLEVYAVDASGARVDGRASLRSMVWRVAANAPESVGGVKTPRWARFARPLDEEYDELHVRWGDPYVEARARLTQRSGMEQEVVELERGELGAVRFEGAGLGGLVVLEDAGPAPALPRVAARSNEPIRFERLEPGAYTWRFGPTGVTGDGVVEAGRTVDVRLPDVEPAADATLVPLAVPDGVPPESVRVVARYMLDGVFARSPLAQPGMVLLTPEIGRSGEVGVRLPEFDWRNTSLGVICPSQDRERLSAMGPLRETGPPSRLVVPKDPPRTEVHIRMKDGAEDVSIWQVVWFTREIQGNPRFARTQRATLSLPADRPTSVGGVGENGQSASLLFDPAMGERDFVLEGAQISPYPIRVVDAKNRPIPGVQITAGGAVVGVTDAAGQGLIPLTPTGRIQDWTVGLNDPGLRPIYPPTKSIRAEYMRDFRGRLTVVFAR